MNDQPENLSGGIRQIEETKEEMVTIPKKQLEGMLNHMQYLKEQLEITGGIARLALPMLGGPLIYTQEVMDEEIDSLEINVSKAKDVLTPRDAFDFGLQLHLDMDKAFVAEVKKRPAKEIMQRRTHRALQKNLQEAADKAKAEGVAFQATPKKNPRIKLLTQE